MHVDYKSLITIYALKKLLTTVNEVIVVRRRKIYTLKKISKHELVPEKVYPNKIKKS